MYKRKNNEREGNRSRTGRDEKPNSGRSSFQRKPATRSSEEDGDKPARKFSGQRERNDNNSESSRSPEKKSFRSGGSDRPFKPFKKDDNNRPARKLNIIKRDKNNNSESESYPKKSYKDSSSERPYSRPYRSDDRQGRKFSDKKERPQDGSFENTRPEGERNFSRPFKRDDKPFRERKPSFESGGEERPRRRTSEDRFNKEPRKRISSSKVDDGKVRLNKLIAASGICSRREADTMITAGLISVNGSIISELGTKVMPSDDIRYNGERLRQERLVYIVMNKPKDFVTTTKDPFAKKTVMELLDGSCKERVFPVGRLDRNTTGVLLITNDGDLAKKLTHPSHNKKKIYHVHLDKSLKSSDIETLVKGFELEDGFIKADEINFIDPEDKKQIGIEIHSGKNRIVRRMFEQLGYEVTKLDRVYFAGLTKKGLQRGHWRFLTNQEVGMLKMGSYQ